jgi:hypothetical protein
MIIFHHKDSYVVAELDDESLKINHAQDILDLFGELISESCNRMVIKEGNFHKDFFNLKTGLAGEILQKFSNYRIKLAIVGDFEKHNSKSLQNFIYECNKGKMILFTDSMDSAIKRLTIE